MKCPICGKDVELKNRQVGTDENGEPVFNEYAVCRDCKKQWNLDKQRAKKMAAKKAAVASSEDGGKKPESGRAADTEAPKAAPARKAAPGKEEPVRKPSRKDMPAEEAAAGKKKPAGKPGAEKTEPGKKPAARRKAAPSGAEKDAPSGSRTKKAGTDHSKVVPYKKSTDGDGTDRAGRKDGSASPKSRPARKRPEWIIRFRSRG